MPEDSDEKAVEAKALMHGLEYVPPRFIGTHRHLARLLPESVARAGNVLPQPSSGTALKILTSDLLDFEAIDRVRFACGRQVEVALASHQAIHEALDRVYEAPDQLQARI